MKTIVTIAIATIFAAFAANAEVVTKGGATALTKAPAVRATANESHATKCGMCKSEFVKVSSPSFKGTAPSGATVERHACASCGTKWITKGHGKAKADTAVHTCAGCKG